MVEMLRPNELYSRVLVSEGKYPKHEVEVSMRSSLEPGREEEVLKQHRSLIIKHLKKLRKR